MMQWSLKKNPVHYVSFESFRLNTGKLPQLVMVQLRKFLTFDPMNQARCPPYNTAATALTQKK